MFFLTCQYFYEQFFGFIKSFCHSLLRGRRGRELNGIIVHKNEFQVWIIVMFFRTPCSALTRINQNRLSGVLGAIVLAFIFSYGPFYVSQMCNGFHFLAGFDKLTFAYITLISQASTVLNSCINPILYSAFTKSFYLIHQLTSPDLQTENPAIERAAGAQELDFRTTPRGSSDAPYVPKDAIIELQTAKQRFDTISALTYHIQESKEC